MGMYDQLRVEAPLPDPAYQERTFQTKSLECSLSDYTITHEGRLVLREVEWEATPEEEMPYYGTPEWERGGLVRRGADRNLAAARHHASGHRRAEPDLDEVLQQSIRHRRSRIDRMGNQAMYLRSHSETIEPVCPALTRGVDVTIASLTQLFNAHMAISGVSVQKEGVTHSQIESIPIEVGIPSRQLGQSRHQFRMVIMIAQHEVELALWNQLDQLGRRSDAENRCNPD